MSSEETGYLLDEVWARRSFDRASRSYDGASVLQAQVLAELLERLDWTMLQPSVALDAGAGTGHASRALRKRYPDAFVIALDSSFGMLREAARQRSWLRPFARVCGAAERLPLPDACADLIVSNLMLEWSDIDAALAECRRVLAPRGLLTFSTLGPATLHELRSAWRKADTHIRVSHFKDMHDVGDALVRAGFAAPVLDVDRYTIHYRDVRGIAADLKSSGARNASRGRLKGLTTPRKFAAMQSAYELLRSAGRLPATCEVIFAQAWTPQAERAAGAQVEVSMEEMRRQLRTSRSR